MSLQLFLDFRDFVILLKVSDLSVTFGFSTSFKILLKVWESQKSEKLVVSETKSHKEGLEFWSVSHEKVWLVNGISLKIFMAK